MHTNYFSKFYDNIIFTQSQIYTTLAEMSDLSLLWKLKNATVDHTVGDTQMR